MAGILTELGYGAIDQRADLSSWVRGFDRVDLIHAQRPIARALLSAAPLARYLDLALNVVDVEGILGGEDSSLQRRSAAPARSCRYPSSLSDFAREMRCVA